MTDLITQVVDMTLGSVNVALVIVLIGVGAILKHAFSFFNNNSIPIVMIVLGIIFTIAMNIPFNPQAMLLTYCVQGIASGYCAVIIHGKSKEIYKDFISDKLNVLDENNENK